MLSKMSRSRIDRSRMGQKQKDGKESGHAFDPENKASVLTVSISLPS